MYVFENQNVKHNSSSDLSFLFQVRLKEYVTRSYAEKEILFERFIRKDVRSIQQLNNPQFGIKLFNSNPPEYMGFDKSGTALKPSDVDKNSDEAYFVFQRVR